jgi:hypothetical protein
MYDCMYNVRMNALMFMQLCIISRKNPTNALTYVKTTLFAPLRCYMFQPSRGHPLGVLIHSASMVNKIRVQL